PLYVMNVTYPVIDTEGAEFCLDKDAVLMVEEGQPEYLEQAINTVLRRKDINARVHGKDVLPIDGDYSAEVLSGGIREFLEEADPRLLGIRPPAPDAARVLSHPAVEKLKHVVPARPPGLCAGCPERPIFAAMKLVEEELGQHHVSADIGC